MGIFVSTLRGLAAPFSKRSAQTPYGNPLPEVQHAVLAENQLKPGRLIVVGDVHGCCDELDLLLQRCQACEQDNIILVGDLVNKGPLSVKVLDRVLSGSFWAVRGNHDEAALQAHRQLQQQQPIKQRFGWVQQLQQRHLDLLQCLPFSLSIPAYGLLVVHAGLVPGVPLEQQRPEDLVLMRDILPAGGAAAGVGAEGGMAAAAAAAAAVGTASRHRWRGLERGEEGSFPWAALWPGPQHVLFGHDAKRKLQQHPHATGLDTGCIYGFQLTAAVFPPLQQLRGSSALSAKLAAGQPPLLQDLQAELVAVQATKVHEAPKVKAAAGAAEAAALASAAGAAAAGAAAGAGAAAEV